MIAGYLSSMLLKRIHLPFSKRSHCMNLSLKLYHSMSGFHVWIPWSSIPSASSRDPELYVTPIYTCLKSSLLFLSSASAGVLHPLQDLLCAREYSGCGNVQSSHDVMLQSLAPSPISNFSRSSFHSVYMSLVALMASLCPGPALAGLASATLRHIPGQGEIVSYKEFLVAVGSDEGKYMWRDSCRSRQAVQTSISVNRHFWWLRRGTVYLAR